MGLCSYVPIQNHLLLFSHLVVSSSFAALWTVARQGPLFMEFPRQEYWSGLSCPPPGDLPNPGIEPQSLTSPALGGSLPLVPPGKPVLNIPFFYFQLGFSDGSDSRETVSNAGDLGWSLSQEDPLEKGMATLSHYSSLENPMDRGAWEATVHGVAKSWTQLSD